jgi:glucose-1-phosphate adenylyltransferase
MVNSGIDKVGIITKQNYQSLMDHVGSGRFYNLARKNGGLIILPPYGGGDSGVLFSNRLEALLGILSFIRRSSEEYVVMSDCDNVCNINYEDVVNFHNENRADITLVYREKLLKKYDKGNDVLTIDSGRVTRFTDTNNEDGARNVYGNMTVMKRVFLLSLLEAASANGYRSFSRDILARQTERLRIYAYRFKGYYASIDSLANYYKHTLQMLDKPNRDSLFAKGSPIYTKVRDSAPTRYIAGASAANSFIADGCVIEGEVSNSVLFRGVHVARGAVIRDSILMQDTVISQGVKISAVITDKNVVIRDGRTLAGCEGLPYYIPKNTVL